MRQQAHGDMGHPQIVSPLPWVSPSFPDMATVQPIGLSPQRGLGLVHTEGARVPRAPAKPALRASGFQFQQEFWGLGWQAP